jgi:uncharacterized membrane protein
VTDRALQPVIAVLASVGIGIAGYLLYTHLTDTPIACSTGGCETVQNSSYAELVGIPVAALGLAAYAGILASALSTREWMKAMGATVALAGFGFAGYLFYIQAEVLGAFCNWCLASDAAITLLAAATVLRVARPG